MMRNILKLNKRDWIGLVCWLLVSILVGLLALPVMVGREIYQYKHYHLSRFEWEDIVRYSVVIVLGSIINFFIFKQNEKIERSIVLVLMPCLNIRI